VQGAVGERGRNKPVDLQHSLPKYYAPPRPPHAHAHHLSGAGGKALKPRGPEHASAPSGPTGLPPCRSLLLPVAPIPAPAPSLKQRRCADGSGSAEPLMTGQAGRTTGSPAALRAAAGRPNSGLTPGSAARVRAPASATPGVSRRRARGDVRPPEPLGARHVTPGTALKEAVGHPLADRERPANLAKSGTCAHTSRLCRPLTERCSTAVDTSARLARVAVSPQLWQEQPHHTEHKWHREASHACAPFEMEETTVTPTSKHSEASGRS